MSKVIDEIAAERRRQVESEGWSSTHDNEHPEGRLAAAGACYAAHNYMDKKSAPHHHEATGASRYSDDPAPDSRPVGSVTVPSLWPWDGKWWKPTERRRDLIKAAALIVAEIERLDRKAS